MKTLNRIFFYSLILMVLVFTNSCKKDKKTLPVSLTDKDGNVYTSVTIGTQEWMVENLKTTRFNNGDSIPTTTSDISAQSTPVFQWAFSDLKTYAETYGRLYTWYAAIDSRNLCPTGWHVPSVDEWKTLRLYLGGDTVAGGKLKQSGTTYWQAPNTGATNESGFTALPGGYRSQHGIYSGIKVSGWFWTTSDDAPLAWGQSVHFNTDSLVNWGYYKSAGVSVRCLKDQ
jgi:uncharacterized protein (TIGR02145 family)